MISLSARALDVILGEWRGESSAYLALADRIRLLVLDGRIVADTRLPAERELATRLGVSRTTVTASYAELREAGYLVSLRGSGSVVRMPGSVPSADLPLSGYLDFTKASMPATPELADAALRAAAQLPAYLGEPGFDPVGLPRLRQALADRYTARGVPTDPEQIMVTIGAQHAIALLARVLVERGDAALVESPSYPHAFEALKAAGARLVAVPVSSADGWDDDALEQALQRTSPAVAYVMPDCHNPTGRIMPAASRARLVAAAERQRTQLIVDETMAELTLDEGAQPLPLAAFGPAITIGSFGKSVWGGVRIGWIRAERGLIQKLTRARAAGDLGTPILEQLIAIDLLQGYDGILAGRREHLRRGEAVLRAELARALPAWTMPHVSAGLTAWVELGAPVSSQLALAARAEGLLIAAGPRFGLDGAFERFLRIPIGYSAEETRRAVDALARAWGSLSRHVLDEPELQPQLV